MIPTPDLSHLTAKDYDTVYEPAEDTFLLLDALEADEQQLKSLHPTISLEIGSGSGCVTSFIGKILGPSVLYLCTDINPHACRCTLSTGAQNDVALDAINGSFANPLSARLKHAVDIVLFNPPYVPTVPYEASAAQGARGIEGAWAGGLDGMSVTDVFLECVEELISDRGRFYLVAVAENNIPEIRERMRTRHGLQSEIVLSRRAGRERLSVLKFVRDPSMVRT
ncbi:putative methyltransferase [Lyophyllum shimeji]|uniref:Methyltransferase n=1 Tax=Lyophyllum shimeji TaxID=47721 RepID=A0A9P3PIB1_LYOSH|nr:putative methyltransferase [Lyophyllum shimeji]